MRTFNKESLPACIQYNNRRYLLDIEVSHKLKDGTAIETIKDDLRKIRKLAVLVKCMSRNLRGKTDLHGKPYQPSQWIYTAAK